MKRVTVAQVLAELRAINANLAGVGSSRRPSRAKPAARRLKVVREPAFIPPRTDPVELAREAEVFAPPPTPPETPGRISPVCVVEPAPTSVLVELPTSKPARLPSTIVAAAAVAELRAAEAAAVAAQREVIAAKAKWRGPCKAVCALTGKACGLLVDHPGDHHSARGPFRLVAVPGQTEFAARAALDRAAVASADSPRMTDVRGSAAEKRDERRRSAHAGDITADDKSVASAVSRGSTS
ncbi:MAG: hypothetical protein DI536_04175 [Archangium gephyra]|uniref:Uncharacterized protein n=1 Tax=Archangium gephyra TaxID=48 RepID=A0A2W5TU14_9BACT|nr:MAG: hypothetical protein DI536_04175 [Archangium gephyra]